MNYPIRLLPKINYKRIKWTEDLNPLFLLRYTPTKDILLPNTRVINPDNLKIQSDHLKDLSTNLLGEFLIEDNEIEIIEKNKSFFDLWDGEKEIDVPLFNKDFIQNKDRGYIFFNIKDILSKKISHQYNQITYNLNFIIVHTPTRCNFWHYSIKVLANDEEISTLKTNDRMKKTLWRRAKEQLIMCASANIYDFGKIDKKHYSNE